jgi:small-conductance mechanosensitive channel
MKISSRFAVVVLMALVVLSAIGLYLTGNGSRAKPAALRNSPGALSLGADQQPLDTARQLATLAASEDEQRLAADALRLADHQVDLAFSSALRTASNQPTPQTPAIRAIQERIDRAQSEIDAGENRVNQLKAEAAKARDDRQADLQQQVEVVQAEVSLHQDELADAQQDLVRAGGDERSKIQQLLDQHEAAEHTNGTTRTGTTAGSGAADSSARNMIAEESAWSTLRSKQEQIAQARQDALKLGAVLSHDHAALDQQVEQEKSARQSGRSIAQTGTQAGAQAGASVQAGAAAAGPQPAPQASAADLKTLHKLSDDEKSLAALDQRIQDLQQLAATYEQWNLVAQAQTRVALHRLIKGVLWILLVILAAFAIQRLIHHSLDRLKLERTQQATLVALLRFVVQTLTLLVIVLVVFGTPSQFSTILGLAGAGLTVALKDFIVAFLGWFVLMGRNGIRVGDWVEINGVRGEVVEIGILRTVLLETGNGTDAGFPTGRQVAFLNGYAVEGHYFNFTTSGQWLWDELQVAVSGGGDPYPLIEKIRAIVERETEGYAQAAATDWQRVAHRYGVRTLPLAPALDLRPSGDGVLVIVRYMTRASDRSEVRTRLNHAVVELLHGGHEDVPAAEVLPAGSDHV